MCDKLQTSKDGSVDLCHGQPAGYSQQLTFQQYSRTCNNNVYSSSNRKQQKNYSKGEQSWYVSALGYFPICVDKSLHYGTDSDQSGPLSGRGRGARRDRHFHAGGGGVSQGQRWPKPESKTSKVNHLEVVLCGPNHLTNCLV